MASMFAPAMWLFFQAIFHQQGCTDRIGSSRCRPPPSSPHSVYHFLFNPCPNGMWRHCQKTCSSCYGNWPQPSCPFLGVGCNQGPCDFFGDLELQLESKRKIDPNRLPFGPQISHQGKMWGVTGRSCGADAECDNSFYGYLREYLTKFSSQADRGGLLQGAARCLKQYHTPDDYDRGVCALKSGMHFHTHCYNDEDCLTDLCVNNVCVLDCSGGRHDCKPPTVVMESEPSAHTRGRSVTMVARFSETVGSSLTKDIVHVETTPPGKSAIVASDSFVASGDVLSFVLEFHAGEPDLEAKVSLKGCVKDKYENEGPLHHPGQHTTVVRDTTPVQTRIRVSDKNSFTIDFQDQYLDKASCSNETLLHLLGVRKINTGGPFTPIVSLTGSTKVRELVRPPGNCSFLVEVEFANLNYNHYELELREGDAANDYAKNGNVAARIHHDNEPPQIDSFVASAGYVRGNFAAISATFNEKLLSPATESAIHLSAGRVSPGTFSSTTFGFVFVLEFSGDVSASSTVSLVGNLSDEAKNTLSFNRTGPMIVHDVDPPVVNITNIRGYELYLITASDPLSGLACNNATSATPPLEIVTVAVVDGDTTRGSPAPLSLTPMGDCGRFLLVLGGSRNFLGQIDIKVGRGLVRDRAGNPSISISEIFGEALPSEAASASAADDSSTVITVGSASGALFLIALAVLVALYFLRKERPKVYSTDELIAVMPSVDEADLVHPEEIRRSRVHLEDEIGEGAFGIVHQAILDSVEPGEPPHHAAVKELADDPNAEDLAMFYAEAAMMAQIDHDHVVNLWGVTTAGSPKFIIMEYCEHSSLDLFLHAASEQMLEVSAQSRLAFGIGVATGMAHLEGLCVVHRDLAARNILLDQTFTVKVSDFGLSRCVALGQGGGQGFYKMTHGANIPVRWTAPEALKDQKYTHASDIWSYGIVLWEIYTNAETPYRGMTNEEVWFEVGNGHRLSKPEICPDSTFERMKEMWGTDPEGRPTFAGTIDSFRRRKGSATVDEDTRKHIAAALGDKVEEDTKLVGLSAHHIYNVVKKFMKVSKSMTTTDVLGRMKRILKNEGTSYCSWASRQPSQICLDPDMTRGVGRATVFVSHAWRYPFDTVCEVISAYAKELAKNANPKHHPGCAKAKAKGGKIVFKPFFWFDIFTVNQFEAATYPQDFWTTTFKGQVAEIGHTLLILHPWDKPIPLSRAWCVWEMYCTLSTKAEMHIRQPSKDAEALDRALAKDPEGTMELMSLVDAEKAEAWKESDRVMIHEAVETTVGFTSLNMMIRERLMAFLQFNIEMSESIFFDVGQGASDRFKEGSFKHSLQDDLYVEFDEGTTGMGLYAHFNAGEGAASMARFPIYIELD